MSRIFDALSRAGGYEELLEPLQEQAADAGINPKSTPAMESPESKADLHANGGKKTEAADVSVLGPTMPPALDSPLRRSLPAGFPGVRSVSLSIPRSVPLLPFDGVNSAASEEYRTIRTRILHHPSRPKVFLISSPSPGDGKTITAVNLGGALALKGTADVLVIDADFARGTLSAITGIPDSPGLGEVLTGKAPIEGAIVRVAQFPRLHFLVGGRSEANPAELLDSEVWLTLMEKLRGRFGYVVFDSPPVEAVPFYTRLLAACDGMILIARPDHTGRAEMNDALRTVPEEKLLGVVLNCNRRWLLYRTDKSYSRYYSKV